MTPESTRGSQSSSGGAERDPRLTRRGVLLGVAFSAVCTHVGCIVNKVANGTIDCPCHGSEFTITNGTVVTGPAMAPLAARQVKIVGGQVILL